MPVTLAKIANNTAGVSFQFGEDTVNLIYYPGHITEKTIASLNAFSTMGTDASGDKVATQFEEFNQMLAGLMKSWDVYEDEAQTIMFPIDASRFPELPFSFRTTVFQAIMRDMRPEVQAPDR